jgi:hypothetical protein
MNIFPVTTTGNFTWYEYRSPDQANANAWAHAFGTTIRTNMADLKQVFGGERGVIYAINSNGELKWYKYTSLDTPNSGSWDPRSGTTIRTGMGGYKFAFGGYNGVIYASTDSNDDTGNLYWFKYSSPDSPDGSWDPRSGAKIGKKGWGGFKQVFGGQNGIIYATTTDGNHGNLRWYQYINPDSPDGSWNPKSATPIGTGGWAGFKQVFGGQNGVIYAITTDGNLRWYKYQYNNPDSPDGSWTPDSPTVIGSGGWAAFSNVNPPITMQLPIMQLSAYLPVNDNQQSQFRICLANQSGLPQSKLGVRFYLDLTSVMAAGKGPNNVVVEKYYEQCGAMTVKPIAVLNTARKIYYVDIEWNNSLNAGQECEALLGFHLDNWEAVWTGVTAFEAQGLNSSTFVPTFHIPILQDGVVIEGDQPSLS